MQTLLNLLFYEFTIQSNLAFTTYSPYLLLTMTAMLLQDQKALTAKIWKVAGILLKVERTLAEMYIFVSVKTSAFQASMAEDLHTTHDGNVSHVFNEVIKHT